MNSPWEMDPLSEFRTTSNNLGICYLGEASDNLKSRYGRRRPFILAFSIVAGLSFIVMPYMKTFLPTTSPRDPGDVSDLFDINAAVPTTTLAIIATCLVILFDFSSQVALSPFGE